MSAPDGPAPLIPTPATGDGGAPPPARHAGPGVAAAAPERAAPERAAPERVAPEHVAPGPGNGLTALDAWLLLGVVALLCLLVYAVSTRQQNAGVGPPVVVEGPAPVAAPLPPPPDPGPAPVVDPDGTWPPPNPEASEVAVTRADSLTVVRLGTRLATDNPYAAYWRRAPYVEVPVIPQQMAMPRLEQASIERLRVQAVTDGRTISWRISWADPTVNGNVDVGRFSDAVAIGFPLDPGAPPMMGAANARVQIIYWKALWQHDIDAGFQDVQDLHPNYWTDIYWFAEGQFPYPVPAAFQQPAARQWFVAHQAGNPMAAFSRTQPVEELVAEGWGSLTHQPSSASTGKGAWVNGTWAVVVSRPLSTPDPLDYTFSLGTSGSAVFAVWQGAAENRGGRKHWSTWVPFEVQP